MTFFIGEAGAIFIMKPFSRDTQSCCHPAPDDRKAKLNPIGKITQTYFHPCQVCRNTRRLVGEMRQCQRVAFDAPWMWHLWWLVVKTDQRSPPLWDSVVCFVGLNEEIRPLWDFFFCQVTHQSFGSLQLPQVKKPHLIVSAIFFSSPLLVLFSQSLSHSFDLLLFSDKGVRLSASANVKGTIASDTLQEMPRLPASKQMKSPQGAVQVSYWRWHPEKRCTILWKARATYTFFFPLLHSVTSDDPSFALLWNLLCH